MNKTKRETLTKTIAIICGIVFVIGVWYLIAAILISKKNYGVPYPHETLLLALKMLFSKDPEGLYSASSTWRGIGMSMLRLLFGYIISFVLGAVLGILAGLFPRVGDFFKPSIGLFKTIPTVGLVMILFALTLAIDHQLLGWIPIALVIVVAFPLLFEAFKAGIRNESREIINSIKLDANIHSMRVIKTILIPDAWPYIRLGMTQSLGLSFKVLIMSEVLTASNQSEGIGTLISLARTTSYDGGLTEVPAYVLIALAIMFIIDIPYIIAKKYQDQKQ